MSAAPRIVPIEEEHAAAFREAVDSVAREERYLAIVQAFPLEQTTKFVSEGIAKRRPHFVAIAGGALVGWCDIIEKIQEGFSHTGVLGMGVIAAHRGQGIGAALMQRTLAEAKAKGFTRIELSVRVDNERAKRLYEKFGFAVEGLGRRHLRIRGRYYDSWLMALLFD